MSVTQQICKMYENYDMAKLSSMKTGGKAKLVYMPENQNQFCELIKSLGQSNQKYIVLGNMTNVLVSDEGFEVPVVLTHKLDRMQIVSQDDEKSLVFASAGINLTSFAYKMCALGFSGLEFAYGIPGSVGGAVFMNAGAYGKEICEVIKTVYAVDKEGKQHELDVSECAFSYRKSIFEDNGHIVFGALFELHKDNKEKCLSLAKETMTKRVEKQPLDKPSCGSTFKRPEGYFAGKLIQDAGLSGKTVGGACVSPKHCGFVVNNGNASTKDVLDLMRHIRDTVLEKFGVELEPEIKLLDKNAEVLKL